MDEYNKTLYTNYEKNMSLEQKHVCQEREEFPSQVKQKRSNAEAERYDWESGILKRGER
jgi:hypothetical protein